MTTMTKINEQQQAVVDVLNRGLELDYEAFNKLLLREYACNEAIADDPIIIVKDRPNNLPALTGLGLVNTVLAALNIPPIVLEIVDDAYGIQFFTNQDILERVS